MTTEEILDDDDDVEEVTSRSDQEEAAAATAADSVTPKFTVTSHTVEHRRPSKSRRSKRASSCMSIASSVDGNFYDLRFDRLKGRHVVPFPEFGVDLVHTNNSDGESTYLTALLSSLWYSF